jgi:hypothetical protein
MADFASFATVRAAVLPTKIWDGLDRLSDTEGVSSVEVLPIEDVFVREWDSDAHFLLYLTEPFDPREPFYRINKPCLHEVRTTGHDVHVRLIALEWDTGHGPEHVPWTQERWDQFHAQLAALECLGHPFAARLKTAAFSYSTRKGWRWVWILLRGCPADDAEPLIRGIAAEAAAAGLAVDQSGSVLQWAQPFRLPRVMRDGKKTSEDPFFLSQAHPERRLDATTVTPVGKAERSVGPGDSDESMPMQEEAQALLHYMNDRGAWADTEFFKAVKKSMQGQRYFNGIFDVDHPFPYTPGNRHDFMRDWTLSAAGKVFQIPETSATHLYALFEPVASAVDQDDASRQFRADTWKMCVGAWKIVTSGAKEVQQKAAEIKQDAVRAELEGADRIIHGVRDWHKGLPDDPINAWAWIQSRMILRVPGGLYHVMKPNGRYSNCFIEADGLIPRIRQLKMQQHIPIEVEGKEGPRPIRLQELALQYIWPVDRVEQRGEVEGAFLAAPDAEKLTLVTSTFRRRRDLVPTFSADVDLWLRTLGGKLYELLCKHIGCFLAFQHGGVAAMSFNFQPGGGKKLLTHGFLECMEEPDHASGEDLVQRFNLKLKTAAFLLVNEGLPEGRGQMYHPSDTLRKIITGDYFQSESKGIDATNAKASIRCILTANHWRLIDALGEGRDLAPHEREALGLRLVHYDPGTAPVVLLKAKGGLTWTRGWIEGDGGEPSDFVVAKHFLWLYEKYGKDAKPTGRLLVEGDPNQEAIQRLRVQGGSTPVLIEALMKLLDSGLIKTDGTGGILIKDSRLYVTIGAILDFWRKNLTQGSADRLTAKRIGLGLKGLIVGGDDSRDVKSIDGHKARWNEIDVLLLSREAGRFGWSCSRLEDLVRARLENVLGVPHANGTSHGVNHQANGAAASNRLKGVL